MKFDITISPSEEYIDDVINTLETFLNSNESEYVVSFHKIGYNIDDSESIIIITGEYERVNIILSTIIRKGGNLKYGDNFDIEQSLLYRTFVIHPKD